MDNLYIAPGATLLVVVVADTVCSGASGRNLLLEANLGIPHLKS